MSNRSIADRRADADDYRFHAIHPALRVGTASDRYAGWIGQIYPESLYANRVSSRSKTLGGQSYSVRKVPIESAKDYFQHFGVLEIDFTFYRPLREADGEPSNTHRTLATYAEHAPPNARFLVKAPQMYTARTLRRGGDYVSNTDYLDAQGYRTRFEQPLVDLLGDRLSGVILQQEYQRVSDSPSPSANVDQWDDFVAPLDDAVQRHLELRSEHLLKPVYFDWLDARGLGHVFSHWTWLPMIRKQWRLCGERFTAANHEAVARLLTPRDMKYATAYKHAYPFDAPSDALCTTQQAHDMVLDATALTYRAAAADATLNLICNNRAWGNAPDLARTIAHRILDEEEKRAAD